MGRAGNPFLGLKSRMLQFTAVKGMAQFIKCLPHELDFKSQKAGCDGLLLKLQQCEVKMVKFSGLVGQSAQPNG